MSAKTLFSIVLLVIVVAVGVVLITQRLALPTGENITAAYTEKSDKIQEEIRQWWLEDAVSDVHETEEFKSKVDWESGIIRVSARGTVDPNKVVSEADFRILAAETAKLRALKNLGMIVDSIQITSGTYLKDEKFHNSKLGARLSSTINGAHIVSTKYTKFDDGSIQATVTLEMQMKELAGIVIDEIPPDIVTVYIDTTKSKTEVDKPEPEYTGLIIDARGMNLKTLMFPQIYTSDNKLVYGFKDINQEFIIKYGTVGYHQDLEKAKRDTRVGKVPLIIEAINTLNKNGVDPVVSREDARRIYIADSISGFLKNLSVIILI